MTFSKNFLAKNLDDQNVEVKEKIIDRKEKKVVDNQNITNNNEKQTTVSKVETTSKQTNSDVDGGIKVSDDQIQYQNQQKEKPAPRVRGNKARFYII